MISRSIFFLFFVALIVSSCATYKAQFRDKDAVVRYPKEKEIEKTFYLVGDAGLSPMGGMSDALTTFKNYLQTETTTGNFTLYLGDNIYPSGMDMEGHPRRTRSENMIDAQYKAVQDYEGPTIFIPGNHEWYNGGVVGVARQEGYVASKFENRDSFKPRNGCPLESIPVTDAIQLIIIDTQWFLEDWNKNPTINEGCDIKTREKFFIDLELELKKNQNKTVLLAMHHPMFTNGNHGGYFALEKHLYPFQKKIPMPFLSSLVVQIRSQGGVSVQDRYNELYNNLMVRLQQLGKDNKRMILASGHDHNLQYIEKDGFKQIVSGAGSKESFAAIGEDGLFSTGQQGFAVLDVFKDGSSWVRYFVVGENYQPELIFQKEVIPTPKVLDISLYPKNFPREFTIPIYKQDSINEALFFRTIWGGKYKNAYSQSVTVPTAVFDTLFGGMEVVRDNSGSDFNSLLLKDRKGNRYRMRAMSKNALKIAKKLVFDDNLQHPNVVDEPAKVSVKGQSDDFYTASHPYAIMAVPDMARAIDVFYTSRELYYVPKQPLLGNYNENFGDALYLISKEPSESDAAESFFKYPDEVETTDDILTKLQRTGNVSIDEENYIKSRLFDMLIGNWQRDPDNWRWAEHYNRFEKNVFVPVPKNRDNAFSSFEGNILDITQSLFGGTMHTHIYGDNLRDFQWFNKEGIILDRALLKNSGRNQWKFLAEEIQKALTDSLIETAFNKVPPEVRDETLEEIKGKLRARRDNLIDIADRYYTYLATLQTIVGTDFDDLFEITRLPEGQTNIRSFTTIDGIKSDTLVNRTYRDKDTKEIWIYGLGGKDEFVVKGEGDNLIFIRLIGGPGEDIYNLQKGRRIKVYDHESQSSVVKEKGGATLRFTDIYTLNTYDYRKQIDRSQNLVSAIGYNPDDGFRAALQYVYRVDNFQRNPFSQKHIINAAYFTNIHSMDISYYGEFANIRDDLNLSFGARFTSPSSQMNFFGFGNETQNGQDIYGYGFNRVEVQQISANIGLLRNSNFGSFFKLQTTFDAFKVNNSPDNFIAEISVLNKNETTFFGTIEGLYSYRSFDNPVNPNIGMLFDLNLGVTDNVENMDQVFGFLKSRIGFYNRLGKNTGLILKTNVNYQVNIGRNFQFYHAANLGGDNGLRGFREQRFSGKSFLVGNADVRYGLPTFKIGLIPIQTGIYGGADLGRVWYWDEDSEKWHNSFGLGFWLNGAGGLNANFSAFNSKEGTRIVFGLGFDF